MKDFYEFSSKFLRYTLQAYPIGLKLNLINGLSEEDRLINGHFEGMNFPIFYKQEDGKKLPDILETGMLSRYLISDKLKAILEDNYLTGWKIYPVKLYDKKNNEILGYHGFSVNGISGRISFDESTIFSKSFGINKNLQKFYKGEFIELDKWDKQDFFIAEGTKCIIITKNAADILIRNNISNLELILDF